MLRFLDRVRPPGVAIRNSLVKRLHGLFTQLLFIYQSYGAAVGRFLGGGKGLQSSRRGLGLPLGKAVHKAMELLSHGAHTQHGNTLRSLAACTARSAGRQPRRFTRSSAGDPV